MSHVPCSLFRRAVALGTAECEQAAEAGGQMPRQERKEGKAWTARVKDRGQGSEGEGRGECKEWQAGDNKWRRGSDTGRQLRGQGRMGHCVNAEDRVVASTSTGQHYLQEFKYSPTLLTRIQDCLCYPHCAWTSADGRWLLSYCSPQRRSL